jgi:hypothetical protein
MPEQQALPISHDDAAAGRFRARHTLHPAAAKDAAVKSAAPVVVGIRVTGGAAGEKKAGQQA